VVVVVEPPLPPEDGDGATNTTGVELEGAGVDDSEELGVGVDSLSDDAVSEEPITPVVPAVPVSPDESVEVSVGVSDEPSLVLSLELSA
jgi:hypothetical protein